jgi:predicted DNA-binding ribbon-helix-helix protein
MLRPEQVAGLRREEAIQLIEELQDVQGRLDRLRSALRLLVEEDA